MSNSGKIINYKTRPAKSVERKMMCEFFRQANKLFPIDEYRYIGFGSFYFVDFTLFHRILGINKMISIEIDSMCKTRYEFNKPFKCIDIIYGKSNDVIPNLNWKTACKDIIWLDYDGLIGKDVLEDFYECVKRVESGSFISISYKIDVEFERNEGKRMPWLIDRVGDYLPRSIEEKDVSKRNVSEILWCSVKNVAERAISEKNAFYEDNEEFVALPVMNFKYNDSIEMMTITYIIIQIKEIEKFESCDFKKFQWYVTDQVSYNINAPQLTAAEIREINRILPIERAEDLKNKIDFVDEESLMNYSKIYKYYPNFEEVNI